MDDQNRSTSHLVRYADASTPARRPSPLYYLAPLLVVLSIVFVLLLLLGPSAPREVPLIPAGDCALGLIYSRYVVAFGEIYGWGPEPHIDFEFPTWGAAALCGLLALLARLRWKRAIDEKWAREAESRIEALDEGLLSARPFETAFREIRNKLVSNRAAKSNPQESPPKPP
jgi:hypothetical protein